MSSLLGYSFYIRIVVLTSVAAAAARIAVERPFSVIALIPSKCVKAAAVIVT